ncbi:MAG: diaminopimelate epimerase [Rhodobacteraceae bacterium]|nr:diaminopimelate epimerase [Paracoccaceae bacterium]
MRGSDAQNTLHFMKWHGAGNDFVIIDSRNHQARMNENLARVLGDRQKGVGFDQLAEIRSSQEASIDLDFWNADGSRAGACGNATRCVARYILDDTGHDSLTIRTTRGVLVALAEDGQVSVNMGQPQLDWRDVPLARKVDPKHLPIEGDPSAVGMGNPHCVFFVENAEAVDVAGLGAAMEHHPLFPQATNVEFASITNRGQIRMRVGEGGTGITLACGSGACATLVAAAQRGLSASKVRVQADGGWLGVDWREDGVWLSGPTAHVFSATLEPGALVDL